MSQSPVENVVIQARTAQAQFELSGQEVVDELVVGLAWAILEPETNHSLAEQAVLDTGLGDVEDKIIKNHRKTLGLLRDLKTHLPPELSGNSRNKGWWKLPGLSVLWVQ